MAPRSIACLTAIAAPVLAVPKMLWPHPWPTIVPSRSVRLGAASWESPGSASYSARMPMIGRPLP